jgi:hypothetical protein
VCALKVKVIPQQAELAPEVPGRLRPRSILTFGTTRVVGRQPYLPAAFTPGEISGNRFQSLSRPQGTWFRLGELRKKSPVTPPGIDRGTIRLVAQCLNHYAIPGPCVCVWCGVCGVWCVCVCVVCVCVCVCVCSDFKNSPRRKSKDGSSSVNTVSPTKGTSNRPN